MIVALRKHSYRISTDCQTERDSTWWYIPAATKGTDGFEMDAARLVDRDDRVGSEVVDCRGVMDRPATEADEGPEVEVTKGEGTRDGALRWRGAVKLDWNCIA